MSEYVETELRRELAESQAKVNRLEGDRASVIASIQRRQPAGSPPPGGWTILIEWVFEHLEQQVLALQAHAERMREAALHRDSCPEKGLALCDQCIQAIKLIERGEPNQSLEAVRREAKTEAIDAIAKRAETLNLEYAGRPGGFIAMVIRDDCERWAKSLRQSGRAV